MEEGDTGPPSSYWVQENCMVELPMVRPKPLFLEILRQAGAKGETFTKDEIINFLKIYIRDRRLYDINHPRIVHCAGDLLAAVFGVDRFMAEDVLNILEENITYTQDTCLKTKTNLVRKTLPENSGRHHPKSDQSLSEGLPNVKVNENLARDHLKSDQSVTEGFPNIKVNVNMPEVCSSVGDNINGTKTLSKVCSNLGDNMNNRTQTVSKVCSNLRDNKVCSSVTDKNQNYVSETVSSCSDERDHLKTNTNCHSSTSLTLIRDNLKTTKSASETESSQPISGQCTRDLIKSNINVLETELCQSYSVTSTCSGDNLKTIKSATATTNFDRDNLKTFKSATETSNYQRDHLKINKSDSVTETSQTSNLTVKTGHRKSNKSFSETESCQPSPSCSQTTLELCSSETDASCFSEVSTVSVLSETSGKEEKRRRRKRKASIVAVCTMPKLPKKSESEVLTQTNTEGPETSSSQGPYVYNVQVDLPRDVDIFQGQLSTSAYDLDSFWFLNEGYVEEDLSSEPPFSESDLSSIRSGEDLLVVCQDSDVEFFADCSESDSNDEDKELTEADNWVCVDCQVGNPPYQRFCNKCWKHRPDWLPITPKSLGALPSSGEAEYGRPTDKIVQPTSDNLTAEYDRPTGKILQSSSDILTLESKCDKDMMPDCSISNTAITAMTSSKTTTFVSQENSGLVEFRRSFSNLQPKDLSTESSELQSNSQQSGKISETQVEDLCIICLAKPKTASLIHGNSGHQVCCFTCARQLKNQGKVCPVCRRPINKVVKNYIL